MINKCNKRDVIKQFCNVRVLCDGKLINDDVWVQNGKIIDPQRRFWQAHEDEEYAADVIIDGANLILAPGFIDLQLNGAFGVDFSSDAQIVAKSSDDDDVLSSQSSLDDECYDTIKSHVDGVARGLMRHGVTAFCPTVITSNERTYAEMLPQLRPCRGTSTRGASRLGVHCEGPFISDSKYGAHPPHLVRSNLNGVNLEDTYGSLEHVSIVTLAPELPGALGVIQELRERGIVASLGHSNCKLADAEEAVNRGATLVTHMFNAMKSFHHRDPGLIGLLAREPIVYYGIICDGIHAAPASVKIAYKTNPRGLVLVTDAIMAMGLKPGKYRIGEQLIRVTHDRALVDHTDTLAGAICDMATCVRNFRKFTDCSIPEALEAASLHPAKVLGIDETKGRIVPGADADIVLLNDALEVQACFIGGNLGWCPRKCDWVEYETNNMNESQQARIKVRYPVPSVVVRAPTRLRAPSIAIPIPQRLQPLPRNIHHRQP